MVSSRLSFSVVPASLISTQLQFIPFLWLKVWTYKGINTEKLSFNSAYILSLRANDNIILQYRHWTHEYIFVGDSVIFRRFCVKWYLYVPILSISAWSLSNTLLSHKCCVCMSYCCDHGPQKLPKTFFVISHATNFISNLILGQRTFLFQL